FNETFTTISVFMEYYNKNIPVSYPHATRGSLEAFRKSFPGLFADGKKWSIDKHRKRLMDWLPSYDFSKEEPVETE
ncbi:MAG: hypothetical protein NT098_02360, partial [Candidatus Parcubacteria bacterium]|nr:hypothetical protein [Candidatus Parcubacteria bacterium]